MPRSGPPHEQAVREGARAPAGRARPAAGVDRPPGPEGRRALRGPRHRRQGRDDQADHREDSTPACVPHRRPAARRPSASGRSGTSSATSPTCPPPARSSSSTAAGTTAPASSASWASAPRRSTRSSCAPARSSSEMLLRSGIILIKYWLSVSDEEQERRFKAPPQRPRASAGSSARWTSRRARRWVDYAEAKDEMFAYTDTASRRGTSSRPTTSARLRLNLISHLLSLIPYEKAPPRRSSSRPAEAGVHAPAAERAELRADALRGRPELAGRRRPHHGGGRPSGVCRWGGSRSIARSEDTTPAR